MQYLFQVCNASLTEPLARCLLGHVVHLAMQKFSSNVIEKSLLHATPQLQSAVLNELASPDTILTVMQDPFANYVLQRALSVAQGADYQNLVEVITPNLRDIRNTPICKRLQTKIQQGPNNTNRKSAQRNYRRGF